ncbi:MAG TPA: leucine--tRNA ligase [Burkholderiaceae bacterium]|nr:leucine--tRNA ligase [Burkholderiaceae bacterium]
MQDNKYVPAEVESAAQAHWSAIDAYRVVERDDRPKFYACSMLPYPSGKLHMGHVRNYTINDVMARYMRMKGYNVLMPMGWDAFGLPAENAAIDKKVAPAQWTYANIDDMKAQMQPLGLSIDWSREVATCDPTYYKWNQWLFLRMLERGIAFKKTQVVNWDPVDNTVLANEQVIDGRGWRSGAIVEKREIPGYYLGITQYAEELLTAIDGLEHWPDQVRAMQRNWIGKSEGVNFGFPYELAGEKKLLRVFTTRADTIMGVTFVAVAAEHPLATYAAERDARVAAFVEECKKGGVSEAEIATLEKKGVPTGLYVEHPLSGERVEVWVGNYVLMGYGEGAVMGVPAHDERDFAFAKKYGLPIKQVIAVEGESFSTDAWAEWYADKERGRCVNSGKYDGLGYRDAVNAIAADLNARGLGEKQTTYRLRDWGISRQRYWGTPIPIIHCDTCGDVPVPDKDLPVLLPTDLVPDGSGNPLTKDERFLKCTCPKCGKPARRETDTMDTFVDSSWYYMRYCCPDAADAMVDARNDYWMPMDQYIGGIEHAVLHLLYARFWTRVMRDLNLVKFSEPFTRLFTQGMLLNECFYREDASGKKRWFYPNEVELRFDDKGKPIGAVAKDDGQPVMLGGIEKMSKSKNNVVEPRTIISKYGADTARLFTMFAGPPDQSAAWSDSGVDGAHRFLKRLWTFMQAKRPLLADSWTYDPTLLPAQHKAVRRQIHLTLQQATSDYDRLQYNTVVSACMKMLNALEDAALPEADDGLAPTVETLRETLSILLRVLYPVAPHIAHALWNDLGYSAVYGELLDAPWPRVDPRALEQDEITLVVQVNGKLRGEIRVPKNADKTVIEQAALADEHVQKFVSGNTLKKVVVVPGKLVNLVVAA